MWPGGEVCSFPRGHVPSQASLQGLAPATMAYAPPPTGAPPPPYIPPAARKVGGCSLGSLVFRWSEEHSPFWAPQATTAADAASPPRQVSTVSRQCALRS
jgi:hypothetical protein